MRTHKSALPGIVLFAAAFSLFTLQASATDNTFDRTFTISGPVRLELSNGSGNVDIRGTADGKVHVHGKVTKGWTLWAAPKRTFRTRSAIRLWNSAAIPFLSARKPPG